MFLLVNPLVGVSASALESEANESEAAREEVVEDAGDDEAMELTATSTDSTMNISFSPTAGTATAPIGTPTKFQVTAKVDIQNSGGYTIYFGSNNQNLTRKGGTETIAPISGNVEFNSLANNTWGYAVAEGNTVADNATYTAVPGSMRGRTIYTNNSTNIPSDSKTYTLSFAARIGTDKPAGTYENSVTMSVVSSPLIVSAFGGITEMQAMTSAICSAAEVGDEAQLKDTRDGKYYWVGKLADGKCWMTQNLALNLSTSKALTSADSDVSANWTPGFNTATQATSSTVSSSSNTETRSWSLGDYYIAYPNDGTSCGIQIGDTGTALSACKADNTTESPNMFVSLTTPTSVDGNTNAHYILGNYYSWNAATAGTGGSITSGQASGSICPKSWRLPTGDASGDFRALAAAGSIISSNVSALTVAPCYFVRGGSIMDGYFRFNGTGRDGDYWSSTPHSNSGVAYELSFSSGPGIQYSTSNRYYGQSVRCVAR